MLSSVRRLSPLSRSFLRRTTCSASSGGKAILEPDDLKQAQQYWNRIGQSIRAKAPPGQEPDRKIELHVLESQSTLSHTHGVLMRNMNDKTDWHNLPLTSAWSFPYTEKALLQAGAPRDCIQLTGAALDFEPNSCVLMVGRDPELLQKVVMSSKIPADVNTQGLLVLDINDSVDEWCDHAAETLREVLNPDVKTPAPDEIQRSFRLSSIVHLREKEPDFCKLGFLVLSINRNEQDRWSLSLPGGKRMLGETALECALRELQKETGLQPIKGASPKVLKFSPRFSSVILDSSDFYAGVEEISQAKTAYLQG